MLRNIIFDWSGTLANDLPPVLDATNRLLEFHGKSALSEREFRESFRLPFRGFYDEILPDVPLDELEVLFGRYFQQSDEPVRMLPHAREFLEFCKARGIRLFILSSARPEFLQTQADALGVLHFFEAIHAGVADKRHALPGILEAHGLLPSETAFIGDMEHDVETALACGVHAIAVLTGYDPGPKLMRAEPEVVVEHLGRLQRLLSSHGLPAPEAAPQGETGGAAGARGLVLVHGLRVASRIGVGMDERSATQELLVDLALVPPSGVGGLGDDLARTIDYDAVARAVGELASGGERRLVETLAEEIVRLVRRGFGAAGARVRIRKFAVPGTEWVGVTLTDGDFPDGLVDW